MLLHLMKLSNLLQKHTENSDPNGLSNSLGDGFLVRQNRIFQQIRKQTLAMGWTYTDQISADYLAFPMGQLENLLIQKMIPYLNNVDTLKALNEKTRSTLDWDHVIDNLKPNYVFHESCHAVARAESPQSPNLQKRLLLILIEESFANTCEFFAIADAHDQVHRNFLEVNSYFTVFEDRTHLKKILEQHSASQIFKFMQISYLHSNFLNERLDEKEFKNILALVEFRSNPEVKILKSLAENVFALNPRFRYTTTEMYLRLNGIDQAVEQALDFDYLKLIKDDQTIHNFINQLSLIAGAPYEHG